jgi:polysaccharide export outer membrane protein
MDFPMRGVRAVILCLLAALALSGYMRTTAPVAQPQSGLVSMAYGQSYDMATTPVAYAAAPTPVRYDAAYRLTAGDKLGVVVYGQEGLTYAIDASGSITMPLIDSVPARGRTQARLASEITVKLRNGYIRDPSMAVEIESFLGEVAAPTVLVGERWS